MAEVTVCKVAPVTSAAIDELRRSLRGTVVLPEDAPYDEARTVFNRMVDRRAALIVRCAEAGDVVASVRFARTLISDYTDDALDTALEHFANVPSPLTSVVLEHNGDGALERVEPDDAAFGHRDSRYNLLIPSLWDEPTDTERNVDWTRGLYEAMRPFGNGDVYVNYLDAEGDERIKAAYTPQKYRRLVELKNKYDPSNFFRLNQNIKPTR